MLINSLAFFSLFLVDPLVVSLLTKVKDNFHLQVQSFVHASFEHSFDCSFVQSLVHWLVHKLVDL